MCSLRVYHGTAEDAAAAAAGGGDDGESVVHAWLDADQLRQSRQPVASLGFPAPAGRNGKMRSSLPRFCRGHTGPEGKMLCSGVGLTNA